MSVKSFEELVEDRRKCIEILRKNGFESGIRNLLTESYPDKAHFLYELLQNAEDAGARQVEFLLEPDALIFVHDGKKLFTLDDVDSITNIGNSTKREDSGSIGKFGIGFKAVFGYTDTPIVHSGEFHFKILDMLLPERTDEDVHHRFADLGKTFFKFPFNNPSKPAGKAYHEIQEGLSSLPSEAMLFLRNIQEIYISFAGKESYVTKTVEGAMVVLRRLGGAGETREARYLRYEKTVDNFTCEDGKRVNQMTLSIAYKLQLKDGLQKPTEGGLSESYRIVPVTKRNVFVFFPAEKETSRLRFCIQAPFATNASRDSVCDTRDNKRLVELLIDLQAESLTDLRDEGFLTTEFLGILPNLHDIVAEMYTGFHTRLVQLFNKTALTPTHSGGYAPADTLYRGSAELKVLSDGDLSVLRGETVQWARNALKNTEADKFLCDLSVRQYDIAQLVEDLRCGDQCDMILSQKSNAELSSLYAQLGEHLERTKHAWGYDFRLEGLKKCPLIRLSNGKLSCAKDRIFIGRPLESGQFGYELRFVHPEIYETVEAEQKKRRILYFFKELGIEECNEAAVIQNFITQYWKNRPELADDEWASYFLWMLKLMHEQKFSVDEAKKFPIRNCHGEYVEISKTYIDESYRKTGLSCFGNIFEGEGVNVYRLNVNDMNARLRSKGAMATFFDHLEDFGIHTRLWLILSPIQLNPFYDSELNVRNYTRNYNSKDEDYDIPFLKMICEQINEPRARLIWDLLISVEDDSKLRAFYQANKRDPGRRAPAQWIATLTGTPWITCRDGICRKPCDVTFDDLPDDWPRRTYEHPALCAVKFGEATKMRRESEGIAKSELRKRGIDLSLDDLRDLDKAVKASGKTLEEIKAILQKSSRGESDGKRAEPSVARELPRRSANNVQTRMESIRKSFESAPEQKYEMVGRSVRVDSTIRNKARTYLRGEYATSHEMFCQLCEKSTPFIARDGNGYFEATQVFTRMHRDMDEQFVALCPVCRAKYDEWVRRSPKRAEEFKKAILAYQVRQGEDFVRIDLPGDRENDVRSPLAGKSMYFTGTHFLDLQQAVRENDRLGGSVVAGADEMGETDSNEAMPFVEWVLKHDAEAKAVLQKVVYAYEQLDRCRQEGRRGSIVMWERCASGHIERVMSFWTDYHESVPAGESKPVACAQVERYCRQSMHRPQ